MIRGIHHTAISTSNLERALNFYRDLLGFEEVMSTSWQAGNEIGDRITRLENSAGSLVMLKAGNAFIELFHYTAPTPNPSDPQRPVCDHGITHICLDVVDIDHEYKRLISAGVEFHCPPQKLADGAIRTTYARDPDGNVVELQEIILRGSPMDLPLT